MTVCIGAIAEDSRAIVMVADKTVAYNGGLPIESDTNVHKIVPIGSSGWYALMAGSSTFAMDVVNQCVQIMFSRSGPPASGEEMMRIVRQAYQECRESEIVDGILKPRLLTKDLYISRSSKLLPLAPSFTAEIDSQIKEYRTDTRLLICGFHEKSAYIFQVSDPGIYDRYDLLGFHAVGIGQETAIARLLSLEAEKTDPLATALYNVFDAKVNAEILQGIGYRWDAEILVRGNPKSFKVPRNIVSLMDRVYSGFPRTPFDVDNPNIPDKWWDRIDKFLVRVMPSSEFPSVANYTGKRKRKVRKIPKPSTSQKSTGQR
jgi:hypothetical protein